MKTLFAVSALIFTVALSGCKDASQSDSQYVPSGVSGVPMTFPAGDQTTYKKFRDFNKPVQPAPYTHAGKWTIYMAATGWTNEGKNIVERLAADSGQMERIFDFLYENGLANKVDTAWIQYDANPSEIFMESLDKVPSNYIPLFLKMSGPRVNYYIYSPVSRSGNDEGRLRYDTWLKPYMAHTKKVGNDYVTTSEHHKREGFDTYPSEYWNDWARHFFIVNPDGVVVDAYLSNMGIYKSYGAKSAIHSLIHHLGLDPSELKVPDIEELYYVSKYSQPYWDKVATETREALGQSSK